MVSFREDRSPHTLSGNQTLSSPVCASIARDHHKVAKFLGSPTEHREQEAKASFLIMCWDDDRSVILKIDALTVAVHDVQ